MKIQILLFVLITTILLNTTTAKNPKITIETELGNIIIELYEKEAPITVSNFLSYVDSNKFVNSSFYNPPVSFLHLGTFDSKTVSLIKYLKKIICK